MTAQTSFSHGAVGKPERERILATAARLADRFGEDAAERDRAGGAPVAQIALLKESGLLKTLIPLEWGGLGQDWSTVLAIVRTFASVDGSLAHLFGYHFSVMNAPRLAGNLQQAETLQRATAAHNWMWGNAVSSLSPTLTGRRDGNRYVLNGFRPFGSGSHVADILKIGWDDPDSGRSYFAAVPADRPGIEIVGDWDGFGQTQTGSGTVRFHDVVVQADEVIDFHQTKGEAISTLIPLMNQSILTSIFIGSAFGALSQARSYTLSKSRAWVNSGVETAADDPWVQRIYGDLWIRTEAAALLTEKADAALDAAWSEGRGLTHEARGEHARVIAAANVLAGNVALDVTSTVFEVMGARSATRGNGFDRFWRNVRIHTLHNPAEYKTRSVGEWVLTGRYPEPAPFR